MAFLEPGLAASLTLAAFAFTSTIPASPVTLTAATTPPSFAFPLLFAFIVRLSLIVHGTSKVVRAVTFFAATVALTFELAVAGNGLYVGLVPFALVEISFRLRLSDCFLPPSYWRFI